MQIVTPDIQITCIIVPKEASKNTPRSLPPSNIPYTVVTAAVSSKSRGRGSAWYGLGAVSSSWRCAWRNLVDQQESIRLSCALFRSIQDPIISRRLAIWRNLWAMGDRDGWEAILLFYIYKGLSPHQCQTHLRQSIYYIHDDIAPPVCNKWMNAASSGK